MKAIRAKKLDIDFKRFGGLIPVLHLINSRKIPELIDSSLGKRAAQAQYSYSDFLTNWMMTMFCSGFRLLKIEKVRKELEAIPSLKVLSHDTLGRLFKKLATQPKVLKRINPKNPNDGEKEYIINENPSLNELLILLTKKMGFLKSNVSYTLDIDATIIESEVYDAKMTYKKYKGFTPMVCMINSLPVYISMRSGNANAHFMKLDCIQKCLELLKNHNITVDRVRIDGAGYKNEVLDYLHAQGIKFVVGANWSNRTKSVMMKSKDWTRTKFTTATHVWDAELGSSPFSLVGSKKVYRMAVIRIKDDKRKKKDKPTKWHLMNGYYYKFVITNDEQSTPHDIFQEYHQRGLIEKNFDVLKNEFGWRILPFSKLNENLVYLIVTAITNNFYHGLLKVFCPKVKQLYLTMRLENFKIIFVQATFIHEDGVVYYGRSDIPHEKLL